MAKIVDQVQQAQSSNCVPRQNERRLANEGQEGPVHTGWDADPVRSSLGLGERNFAERGGGSTGIATTTGSSPRKSSALPRGSRQTAEASSARRDTHRARVSAERAFWTARRCRFEARFCLRLFLVDLRDGLPVCESSRLAPPFFCSSLGQVTGEAALRRNCCTGEQVSGRVVQQAAPARPVLLQRMPCTGYS
jgi:hypothetical protein